MYTTENKIANAIKWIDYLEVTTDKQGRGELGNSDTGYCCLGIGCKLILSDIDWKGDEPDSPLFADSVGLHCPTGSLSGKNYFNLDKEGLKVGKRLELATSLMSLNDDARATFNTISKLIKDNVEYLFEEGVAKGIINHYQKSHKS